MGDIIQGKMLIKEIRNVIRRCQFQMTFPRFRDLEFSFISSTEEEIQDFFYTVSYLVVEYKGPSYAKTKSKEGQGHCSSS